MKKWGLVVTLFYGLLVLGLFVPVIMVLASGSAPAAYDLKAAYANWLPWACAGIVMLGEGLLLWLSVDTAQRNSSRERASWSLRSPPECSSPL